MNTKSFLLTALAILTTYTIVMACDEDKMLRKSLIGKWELVKTDCCGRTSKTIPAKPGEKEMHFKRDGSLIIKHEGKTYNSYFNLLRNKEFDERIVLLQIGRETTPAMFNFDNDTLVISWGFMDLQTEYYVKKK